MARHVVSILIDEEVIVKALHMPSETEIVRIERHPSAAGVWMLIVEHPDLPLALDSQPLELHPAVTVVDGVHLWNWNMPDGRNKG